MKYAIIALLFIGCASPVETINREIDRIIRVDTVTVYLPAEPNFTPVVLDNYGFGENDKVQVRVDTIYKVKQIYVKGKADTVKVAIPDTIVVTREKIVTKDTDFFGGITFKDIIIGSFIGFLALIGLRIAKVI